MKLGIALDSLGSSLRAGLADAQKLGVTGIQLTAIGDLAPHRLGESARREIRFLLRSHGLELTSLACPLRRTLAASEDLDARLERICQAMNLSFDLGGRCIVIAPGPLPDTQDPSTDNPGFREALAHLGRHGDRTGTRIALETGLDSGESTARYLAAMTPGAIGVCYDPANLLLHGFDPISNLFPLKDLLLQVQARDARRASSSQLAHESPLGQGEIDWMQLLGTLSALEFRGWLVATRSSGNDRLGDLTRAVQLLKRLGA